MHAHLACCTHTHAYQAHRTQPVHASYSHSHRQDGGHAVQRGDEDANLTDKGSEQQGPRGLPVGFPMAEHLMDGGRWEGREDK